METAAELRLRSATIIIRRAMGLVSKLFSERPECRSLFAQDKDPMALLIQLASGYDDAGLGGITLEDLGPADETGLTYGETSPFKNWRNGEWQYTGAKITINTNSRTFRDLNDVANTLIHELGHFFFDIYGKGSTKIGLLDDKKHDPKGENAKTNGTLIYENCFK